MRLLLLPLLAACAPSGGVRGVQCPSLPEGVLLPDAAGPPTQIHGYGAVDARGAWVAWNRVREGSSAFDVWLAHLGCDGTVDVGPLPVSDSEANDLDPAIAVREDGVLVAWQADVGGERNLRVRWRLFDPVTGQALGKRRELDATGSAWMPAVAASPDGFVVAVAAAGSTVFETHLLTLDADGALVADEAVGGDPGEGDSLPSVDVAGSGAVVAAWQRGDEVWWRDGDGVLQRLAPEGQVPAVSAWGDTAWLGHLVPKGLKVAPAGEGSRLTRTDAPPTGLSIAATDEGAFVGWYAQVDGFYGSLHLGRVDAEGALVGQVELAADDVPAPYPLRVVRADADHAFVVWQEGRGQEFQLKAAFVAP
ncbi:MAG: hypothetical protein H6732_03915 [Alphaproteobacteria bacterium]|nr:hypothetical protein [Alphaproteobacteria bacterium]